MSRYRGNSDECGGCGMTYGQFRTPYPRSYSEAYQQFWSADPDPSTWRNKRRATVLGRWHQCKREFWAEHRDWCEGQAAKRRKKRA